MQFFKWPRITPWTFRSPGDREKSLFCVNGSGNSSGVQTEPLLHSICPVSLTWPHCLWRPEPLRTVWGFSGRQSSICPYEQIKNTTETGAHGEIHVCVYVFCCSCSSSMRLLRAYTNFASSSILILRDIVSRIKWQSAKVISWCWTWIPTRNLVAGHFLGGNDRQSLEWKCVNYT